MRIAYVTAQAPFGKGEAFILPEVLELKRQGHEVVVFPLRPGRALADGQEAADVAHGTVAIPLFSIRVLIRSLSVWMHYPLVILHLLRTVLRHSGSYRKVLKNLAVFPKGLVLGEDVRRAAFDHIHAHWASTPSTAAYIASRLSGVPFSFTAHRWDIPEDNLLDVKTEAARFVRVISLSGAEEIKARIPVQLGERIRVIHMGVTVPSSCAGRTSAIDVVPLRLVAVGNLVPVKGHVYLIDACKLLRERELRFRCHIFGEGPLGHSLQNRVDQLGLSDAVALCGAVSHDAVLEYYHQGNADIFVHPSIETSDGEREGIPVALMEAMAAGIPVVATSTGAIPELVTDGTGLLVSPKDPKTLADAIEQLAKNPELRRRLGEEGRKRIKEDFSLELVCRQLAREMIAAV